MWFLVDCIRVFNKILINVGIGYIISIKSLVISWCGDGGVCEFLVSNSGVDY